MEIHLTTDEVLTLMKELGSTHWMYRILLNELNESSSFSSDPVPSPLMAAHPSFKDTIYFDDVDLTKAKDRKTEDDYKVNNTKIVEMEQCRYSFYGNRCEHYSVKEFCEKHLGKKCSVQGCDNQMDHGCPVELQFVCESTLCSTHPRCATH